MKEQFYEWPIKELPDDLASIRDDIFTDISGKIKKEFDTTLNTYGACLAGKITNIEILLSLQEIKDYLGAKRVIQIQNQIEVFKKELEEFKKSYPNKESQVSEQTLAFFIDRLESFKQLFQV